MHKQVQGDGHIRLRTQMPQHCHSRESGNPWSHIAARDTFLVRTKTRRQGATSLCLRAFVRTILPIDVIGPSLRWGDENKAGDYSQRHAELVSASIVPHRPKCAEAKWTLKQVQGDGFEGQ
jgi:hypothetical protein